MNEEYFLKELSMKNNKHKVIAIALACALALPMLGCNKDSGKDSLTDSEKSAVLNPGLSISLVPDAMTPSISTTTAPNGGSSSATSVTTVTDAAGKVFEVVTDANGQETTKPYVPPVTTTAPSSTTSNDSQKPNAKMETRQALWMDLTQKSDFSFNGQFLKFTFKIKDGAADGKYTISLSDTDFSTYMAETLTDIKTSPAYIGVNTDATAGQASGSGFNIVGNAVKGKPGDTVDVIFNVENNPGFAAFNIQFKYDANALEYVNGGAASDFATVANIGVY